MTPEQLKASILQYAVEGKLVKQNPSDEPASELIKKIENEKAELVKEGKIKKSKKLPAITDDEKPFDIPDSWEWVRLGNIGDWGAGATPSRQHPEYYGGDVLWLKTGDLNDGVIQDTSEKITEAGVANSSVKVNQPGNILIAMYGATIGKLGIVGKTLVTNQACCGCTPFKGIYNLYLFYYLLSARNRLIELGSGGAQPNISKTKIENFIFPLPPLEEQKRIVAKIKKLMPLVDEYAESYNRLQKIDNEFEDKLKQSVLQYAMEGKLVKQNLSDEPASELVKKIENKKAELIKEGKIKKSKKLPTITDDEKPFDIPDSWEWVRLGNIFDITSSKRVMKKEWRDSGIPFYRAREIVSINKNRPLKDPIFIDEDTYLKKIKISGKPNEGDILLTGVGTLGIPYIVPKDKKFYFKDGNIIWLKNFGNLNSEYLSWYVQCPYMLKIINDNRGTTVGTLTIVRSKNLVIPIPPLEEQKRIVAKIQKLQDSISSLSK